MTDPLDLAEAADSATAPAEASPTEAGSTAASPAEASPTAASPAEPGTVEAGTAELGAVESGAAELGAAGADAAGADAVEPELGAGRGGVPGGPVKSALRTVELLEYFAGHRGSHSLAELQQRLGYPKSSLYMLLRTLCDMAWVETDPTGTLYRIGLRALLVGTSYLDADPTLTAARDTLDWLAATTNETVHLARLDGADVVYLATRESQHYLRPISRVGRRLPAHCTSLGKALLAERTEAEVRALLPDRLAVLTEYTLADHPALAADLADTRQRGYAIDAQENAAGLRCFGAALRYQRPARDAISCSVPLARLTPGRQEQIVAALLTARQRLDRILR